MFMVIYSFKYLLTLKKLIYYSFVTYLKCVKWNFTNFQFFFKEMI